MSLSNKVVIESYSRGYRILIDGSIQNPKGKILKGHVDNLGYLRITFRIDNKIVHAAVHRLQAYQKYGDLTFDTKIHVRHKNNNPLDNSYENILIGTPSDNMMDKTPETRLNCAINASSYIKVHDHIAIIKRRNEGAKYTDIMKEFNISSKGTVSFIINKSIDLKII